MDHNYVFICSTEPLHTKNTFRELDFRVIQVLTDSSGTSRYGDSGSILKNRKIGALTYKSELAVGLRTHTVFYGLRYVTVRAVTVTYGSLEQKFYGRFHTGRYCTRSIGYVPYTAVYSVQLFPS